MKAIKLGVFAVAMGLFVASCGNTETVDENAVDTTITIEETTTTTVEETPVSVDTTTTVTVDTNTVAH